MKKLLSVLFVLTIGVGTIFAAAVKIGSLYYNLNDEDKTAEVARMPSGEYTGSITIPATVTSDASVTYDVTGIAEMAFHSCTDLTSVKIPNSIVNVGEMAFYDCPKLEAIVYNDHVFAHLPQSYSGSYTIPDGIELIAGGAIDHCPNLTAIEIPSSVNKIGKERPFYLCGALKSINVAKDNSTFCSEGGVVYSKDKSVIVAYPCGRTGNFSVPSSVKTIGPCAFASNHNIQKVFLPNQLTLIDEMAFLYTRALTTINIPNSVIEIRFRAFDECESLESVIIGSGVKSIARLAFSDCIALASITCKAVTPPTCESDGVFWHVDTTIPLYVPKNSVEVYIRTDTWKLFKNNTYPIGSAIDEVNATPESKGNKVMRNGVLYIEKNGELFNLNGARVR